MARGAHQLRLRRRPAEDASDPARATARDADVAWFRDELAHAWRAAESEASLAYQAWRESPGSIEYAVYRAAQDRADQAQDVLSDSAAVHRAA
jgi:hypothetical protein